MRSTPALTQSDFNMTRTANRMIGTSYILYIYYLLKTTLYYKFSINKFGYLKRKTNYCLTPKH